MTFEALEKYPCDIFCDTTGLAFSYCIVKWILPEVKVVTYVHYPFISSDMLNNVDQGNESVNNS
jgi:alpha-1,2-mannosyltransferase